HINCSANKGIAVRAVSSHIRLLTVFPTRRSSDLNRDGIEGAAALGQADILKNLELAGAVQLSGLDQGIGDAPHKLGEQKHREGRDRKSTRLNSSHVSISYAVFCLKKKEEIAPRYP